MQGSPRASFAASLLLLLLLAIGAGLLAGPLALHPGTGAPRPGLGDLRSTAAELRPATTVPAGNGTAPYHVTVRVPGLPTSTHWLLYVNGSYYSSDSGNQTSFPAWNASYRVQVDSNDFNAYLTYDQVVWANVSGASITVNVTFEKSTLAWFNATGLPSSSWGLSIEILSGPIWAGTGFGGSSQTVAYQMLNGTYTFSARTNNQTYVPATPIQNFTVAGKPVYTAVPFVLNRNASLRFYGYGLPAHANFTVSLAGPGPTNYTAGPSNRSGNQSYAYAGATVPAGNYSYRTTGPAGYAITNGIGQFDAFAGSSIYVYLNFSIGFPVTFRESGLPSGTPWSVQIHGSALDSLGTNLTTTLSNGSYTFSISSVPGYAASPASGTLGVHGSGASVGVNFTLVRYPVEIQETGLPALTNWSVNVSGVPFTTAGSNLTIPLTNGSYALTVVPVPGYGATPNTAALNISGSGAFVSIQFVPLQFSLTFRETGLPTGMGWAISIGSSIQSSLTSSIRFSLPDGSYGYVLLAVPSFVATNGSGSVVLQNANRTVDIAFSPQSFPIVFVEFGLPAGTNWSVTITNATTGFNETRSSIVDSIVVFLPNGTYQVTFHVPPGYAGSTNSTTITVAGKASNGPPISFTPVVDAASPAPGPLPWVGLGAILALLTVSGVIVVRRWARAPPPGSPPPPG